MSNLSNREEANLWAKQWANRINKLLNNKRVLAKETYPDWNICGKIVTSIPQIKKGVYKKAEIVNKMIGVSIVLYLRNFVYDIWSPAVEEIIEDLENQTLIINFNDKGSLILQC